MPAHRGLAQRGDKPGARCRRVLHRLLRRECLRADDEERRRRIKLFQRVGDVRAVDIGDEMEAEIIRREGAERAHRHGRAEVRAADADVDDRRQRLSRRAFHGAGAHPPGEETGARPLGEDIGHDVAPRRHHRTAGEIAQRGVQDRARLARIDDRAGEHGVALFFNPRGAGEREEQLHRLVGDEVFGIIEKETVLRDRHAREAPRVRRQQSCGDNRPARAPMRVKRGESGVGGRTVCAHGGLLGESPRDTRA